MTRLQISAKKIQHKQLPSALNNWQSIIQKIKNKKIILFLDYDGTLAPIAQKPELALITADKKHKLYQLSQLYLTSVVSGRLLLEQLNLIDIEDIYYICNHGYEIKLPSLSAFNLKATSEFNTDINEAYLKLKAKLDKIEGIIIENKKQSLSVHFRLVKKELVGYIEASIDDIVENQIRLRKHYAKKVFEIRPYIHWDIGHAIMWLIAKLNLSQDAIFPIYIGDDITDEPGFEFVNNYGMSIIVADYYRPTFASYSLTNVNEVWKFLDKLMFFAEQIK